MKLRFICFCSALVMLGANLALGAGNYQHTKDGKVTVWNDDPKPGDTAQWFGDRDKENYATGVGTLIWYTGDGALYARYHGHMVHGKFDGAVNVRSKGKTAHAIFVDGKRTSRWAAGTAPSRAEPDRRLTAKPSAEKAERPTVRAGLATDAQRSMAATRATEQRAPAAQPKPDKPRPEGSIVAKKEPAENPVTEKQDIPAEGPSAEKKSVIANPSIGGLENTTTSSVGKDRSATPNAESPGIQNSTKTSGDDTNALKLEIDDLLSPPPTLRTDPIVETPSTAAPQTATSPGAKTQLTAEQAVNLADTEAHAQGYDLDQYQRPKADYSKVKGKWSLIYDLKQPDAAGENAPYFRVSVDDETRKVEVSK